jgi:hypothetical protein
MIRSLLEVQVRRSFFSLESNVIFVPKKSLDVPIILAYCRRKGLRFQYSNEIMNLVWENLNLVVHFGFKLNRAVLWYMFLIARYTQLVAEGDENSFRQKVREVLEELTADRYVERLDAQTLRSEGFTIYWRY